MADAADAAAPAAEPEAKADAPADTTAQPPAASADLDNSVTAQGGDTYESAVVPEAAAKEESEPAPVGRARSSALSTPAAAAAAAAATGRHVEAPLLAAVTTSAGGQPDSANPLGRNTQTKFFKHSHIFVEMDELREKLERDPVTHRFERNKLWTETHRWNFGLQEDLDEAGGMIWNHPHLPWCSAEGLVGLKENLSWDTVLLDVAGVTLNEIARGVTDAFVKNGTLNAVAATELRKILLLHGDSRRRSISTGEGGNGQSSSRLKQSLRGGNDNRARKYSRSEQDDDFALGKGHARAKDEEEFDLLCPEELEEAADVLVGDFEWLDKDLVAFVRLETTLDMRLERHAQARFLVFVVGPAGDEAHERHIQMGEAAGALLQDEVVVAAAYAAHDPDRFLEAASVRMNKLTVIPHIHRPTDQGMKKRMHKLRRELAAHSTADQQKWVGGEWDVMAEDAFKTGYTVSNLVKFMEKYALPLLMGIAAALIIKNVDADWYQNLEAGHHGASDVSNTTGDEHHAREPPLLFGLTIAGHPVNLHFVANDILMCFHFAIATEEITESFLPGAILYPPTKAAVNPLGATIGGVFCPILFFFIFSYIFDSAGAFDDSQYNVEDVLKGWAIPTATDIPLAWCAALLTFGQGHPAINYLLLLAVVDDALGMLIIALFYPDPDNPTRPEWLLLVILAMMIGYVMRKLHFMDWRPYIFLLGPVAWYGMLRSGLHPALSLCFIVPLMPNSLPPAGKAGSVDEDTDSASIDSSLTIDTTDDSAHESASAHHEFRSKIPLFHFEHSAKGYVDFIILPLFGLVNAGVDCTTIGPFSAVIWLSATVGKTIGIGVTAWLLQRWGYHPPKGMTTRSLFLVGYLASVGLTVALFVSDAAFSKPGTAAIVQNEAKLGVLVVMFNALLAIFLGQRCGCKAYAIDDDDEDEDDTDDDPNERDGSDMSSSEDDDEFLEHVVAIDFVDRLRKIHLHVKDVENETRVSRKAHQKSLRERLHELQEESNREEYHVYENVHRHSLDAGSRAALQDARARAAAKARASRKQSDVTEEDPIDSGTTSTV